MKVTNPKNKTSFTRQEQLGDYSNNLTFYKCYFITETNNILDIKQYLRVHQFLINKMAKLINFEVDEYSLTVCEKNQECCLSENGYFFRQTFSTSSNRFLTDDEYQLINEGIQDLINKITIK
jgi:hypothetical protein